MLEGMFMFAMTEWWPFSEYVRTVMLVIYHSIPLCVYCDPAIMIFFFTARRQSRATWRTKTMTM